MAYGYTSQISLQEKESCVFERIVFVYETLCSNKPWNKLTRLLRKVIPNHTSRTIPLLKKRGLPACFLGQRAAYFMVTPPWSMTYTQNAYAEGERFWQTSAIFSEMLLSNDHKTLIYIYIYMVPRNFTFLSITPMHCRHLWNVTQ